jgi:multidrug efflux pump subunit AcrA (membrane-fusion protein)
LIPARQFVEERFSMSSRDGVVKRVSAAKGDNVEKDQTLVIIGDPDDHEEPAL